MFLVIRKLGIVSRGKGLIVTQRVWESLSVSPIKTFVLLAGILVYLSSSSHHRLLVMMRKLILYAHMVFQREIFVFTIREM